MTSHENRKNTSAANTHLSSASASVDPLSHDAASSKASVPSATGATGATLTRAPSSLRALLLGCAVWPFLHAPTQSCLQEDQLSAYRELLQQTQEHLGSSHSCCRGLALMADALTGIAEHCRREGSKEAPIDCLPAEAEHQSALTQLAVERTWLYRGVSETGPTPPYEAEWCTGTSTSTVLLSLTKSYRASGLALALGERADYLGIELGYYQRLTLQQVACEAEDDEAGGGNSGGGESTGGRPRRDSAGGSGVRTLQQRFHSEHLGRWVAPYVKATLPLAQSDFFRGHLLLVQGCVARELIQEPAREPT